MNTTPENARQHKPKPPVDPTIAGWSVLANVALIIVCLVWGFVSMFGIVWIWVLPLLAVVTVASLIQTARRWGTWSSLKGPGFGLLAVVASVPVGVWHSSVLMDRYL